MSMLSEAFGGLTKGLFGDSTTKSNESGTRKGTTARYTDISQEGLDKIVADILGSEQGLAQIFGTEAASGLYSSSVAKQASGDLVTKLAGELAKLTAKDITEEDIRTTGKGASEGPSKGLFGVISGTAGAVKDIGSIFG